MAVIVSGYNIGIQWHDRNEGSTWLRQGDSTL